MLDVCFAINIRYHITHLLSLFKQKYSDDILYLKEQQENIYGYTDGRSFQKLNYEESLAKWRNIFEGTFNLSYIKQHNLIEKRL